jgi:hypothetical protein
MNIIILTIKRFKFRILKGKNGKENTKASLSISIQALLGLIRFDGLDL